MKSSAADIQPVNNSNDRPSVLFRLIGALSLYICFGLIAE
jgi:hypothetical protein